MLISLFIYIDYSKIACRHSMTRFPDHAKREHERTSDEDDEDDEDNDQEKKEDEVEDEKKKK